MLEYADGCDLFSKLMPKKPISEKIAMTWFTQACLGLAYMHSQGKTHRDVKPGNILIVGGMPGVAKIGDFGSIKEIDVNDD